jgi:hypothetical protein
MSLPSQPVDSRLVNGKLFVVLKGALTQRGGLPYPQGRDLDGAFETLADKVDAKAIFPADDDGRIDDVRCDSMLKLPAVGSTFEFQRVVSYDVAAGKVLDEAAIPGSDSTVYMTEQTLYTVGRPEVPQVWEERGYDYPKDVPIDELVFVPENAQYYAALGAVLYGLHEPKEVGWMKGLGELKEFITTGRKARLGETAGPPLSKTEIELEEFRELYKIPKYVPETLEASLQLSEAVLVDIGVAMGPVIASIHEKRSELRSEIMAQAEMEAEPRLGRRRLRDAG